MTTGIPVKPTRLMCSGLHGAQEFLLVDFPGVNLPHEVTSGLFLTHTQEDRGSFTPAHDIASTPPRQTHLMLLTCFDTLDDN